MNLIKKVISFFNKETKVETVDERNSELVLEKITPIIEKEDNFIGAITNEPASWMLDMIRNAAPSPCRVEWLSPENHEEVDAVILAFDCTDYFPFGYDPSEHSDTSAVTIFGKGVDPPHLVELLSPLKAYSNKGTPLGGITFGFRDEIHIELIELEIRDALTNVGYYGDDIPIFRVGFDDDKGIESFLNDIIKKILEKDEDAKKATLSAQLLLNPKNSTFKMEKDEAKRSPLVEKLASDNEPLFLEALSQAIAMADSGDVKGIEAIREAIRIRSGNPGASFYEPGMVMTIGFDRYIEARPEIVELAKNRSLQNDPAHSGNLISAAIFIETDMRKLLSEIYAAGGASQGYAFQLIFNELRCSSKLKRL